MKNEFETKLNQLMNPDTPYFCGSAVFLSLEPIFEYIKKDVVGFSSVYPDLLKVNHRLYEEDTRLFGYAKKKEDLLDQEWKDAILILMDYALEIRALDSLSHLFKEMKRTDMSSLFALDSNFLKGILQETLAVFYAREDRTPAFERVGSDALMAIRGGEE